MRGTDYIVLMADCLNDLAVDVNTKLADGYEFVGGIGITNLAAYQAMCKPLPSELTPAQSPLAASVRALTERPAWQQRVIEERDQLAERLSKLERFLDDQDSKKACEENTIDAVVRQLMDRQRLLMGMLLDTLNRRISLYR